VHFDLRQKTRLGALRVRDDVLMLQSLLWDDEVREADFAELHESVRVSAKELEMASRLVTSYFSDFTPEKFTDDYQDQLRTLIDAKLKQGAALDTEATFGEVPEKEGGEVVDLMEALRKSVEKNRGGSKGASSTKKTKKTKSGGAAKKTASGTRAKKSASKTRATNPSKARATKRAS